MADALSASEPGPEATAEPGRLRPVAYLGVLSLAYEGLPANLLERRTAEAASRAAHVAGASGRPVEDLGVVFDAAGAASAAARLASLDPAVVVLRCQGAVRADLAGALGLDAGPPVLLWAPTDHPSFPVSHRPIDAVAGAGPVGAFALGNALLRADVPFRVDDDPALAPSSIAWLRAAGLASDLRHARFGSVGGPWPGMVDIALDADRFTADFGGTWEEVALPDPGSAEPVALGSSRLADSPASLAAPTSMDPALVERSCRIAGALLAAAGSAFDAVAVRCHSDEVGGNDGFGVMACLGVSLLGSRGIPATCTGDMVTAVAMFIAGRLGGAVQYFEVDGPDAARDALLLSNGGELDLRSARAGATLVEQQFFSGMHGRGLALRGVVAPGPATLVAFTPDSDGWRLITLEGDVLDAHLADFPVPHAFLRSSHRAGAAFRALGDAGTPHHVALAPGHVADVVAALCTLVPVRHIAL